MSKILKKFVSVKGQLTGLYRNKKIVADYYSKFTILKERKRDFASNQAEYMDSLRSKVAAGDYLSFDMDGDSLTYGQDEFSNDKRPTFSDPTLDTSVYRDDSIQAGVTYPEVFQAEIGEFLSNSITVRNRGVSGMHAQTNLEVWKESAGADIHAVMLGTNDCRKNIPLENFFDDMSKIIERRLNWGAAVVLIKPPFKREPDKAFLGFYRDIIELLGKIYDIPVWDAEDFITDLDRKEFFCDKVHFNSKGYQALGKGITEKFKEVLAVEQELKKKIQ